MEFNPRLSNPKDEDGALNTVNVNWPLPYTRSISPVSENGFAVVTQTWYDYSSMTDSDSQSSESPRSFCFNLRSFPVPRIHTRVQYRTSAGLMESLAPLPSNVTFPCNPGST